MHLEDATGELDATLVGKHGSEFFRVCPPLLPLLSNQYVVKSNDMYECPADMVIAPTKRSLSAGKLQGGLCRQPNLLSP